MALLPFHSKSRYSRQASSRPTKEFTASQMCQTPGWGLRASVSPGPTAPLPASLLSLLTARSFLPPPPALPADQIRPRFSRAQRPAWHCHGKSLFSPARPCGVWLFSWRVVGGSRAEEAVLSGRSRNGWDNIARQGGRWSWLVGTVQRGSATGPGSHGSWGQGQHFDPDVSHSPASFFSHSGCSLESWGACRCEWLGLWYPSEARLSGHLG